MVKRILVIDDNQDILDIINEVLLYERFKVRITTNAGDIIETIQTFKPDLVMLDYKLVGCNGDDICRQIKAHPQLNNIPVVICSAYLNKSDLLACGAMPLSANPLGWMNW